MLFALSFHDSSFAGQVVKVTCFRVQDAFGRQVHGLGRAARRALEELELRRLEVRAARLAE
jgi:hypothetical protein